MKQSIDIEDYSVRQTTLDDVFINFAKQQSEPPSSGTEHLVDTSSEVNDLMLQPFPPEDDSSILVYR
ncbi:phospholipid-transporting ATPase ABCA1-like [Saccoglossus kowalevskii]